MSPLTHADMPTLRAVRDCIRNMLAHCNAQKAAESDPAMLLAYAAVLDQLQDDFDRAGKALSKLEHRRPQAAAPGCRGGAPAVKGHGCPAFASAVGPAPASVSGRDITRNDDPLFAARRMQDLPGSDNRVDNGPRVAGEKGA